MKAPVCIWCGKSLAWALCAKRLYCPQDCRDNAAIVRNLARDMAKKEKR